LLIRQQNEKINMKAEEGLKKVKAFLGKQDFVRVAYIFGSYAEGRQGPLSDLDFAVLLDNSLSKSEISKKKMFLINGISSVLRNDNFDLVIMNDARLLMRYNIIKQGKVLKSGRERIPMEARIMCDYLDRKYYEDMHANLTLERISREGIL
jgi:predicted nucleotidyltransferase